MASCFIDIDIQGDKEIQTSDRSIKLLSVGRGKDRVTGVCDQRANLSLARCQHFFGHHGHGKISIKLWQPSHSRMPTRRFAISAFAAHQRNSGRGKHLPTAAIQVSCDQVDCVDQPMTDAAMLLSRNAHSAVDHRPVGRSKFACQFRDRFSADSGFIGHGFGSEIANRLLQAVYIFYETVVRIQVGQRFGKEDVQNRCQQKCIRTGADEMVLICQL